MHTIDSSTGSRVSAVPWMEKPEPSGFVPWSVYDIWMRSRPVPGCVSTLLDERSQLKNRAKAMAVLRARLLVREQERRDLETGTARRAQIGRGERSEKMRTYNFPQDRLTDKRLGYNLSNLERRMDGDIDDMIDALAAQDEAERLSSLEDETD